ncbi:MAG: DUF4145 domain-containing protein [Patescibacteria group bacterium]|nr:DUF4145 domain-containing protein [Patescibacteria group bacterium]
MVLTQPNSPKTARTIRQISFCPHCSNTAPQRLLLAHSCEEEFYTMEGDVAGPEPMTYYVAECETCHKLLIYKAGVIDMSQGSLINEDNFTHGRLVFPRQEIIDSKLVPPKIRACYQGALKVKNIEPNAFAGQVRRTLEAICIDRSASGSDLATRIQDLIDKGDIPLNLSEVADIIRLLGNVGSHFSDKEVKPFDVHPLDDFIRVVIEYVYIAPGKIKQFQKPDEVDEGS